MSPTRRCPPRFRAQELVHDDEAAARPAPPPCRARRPWCSRAPDRHSTRSTSSVCAAPLRILERQLHAVLADLRLLDRRPCGSSIAALLKAFSTAAEHVVVLEREHAVEGFDHRDLGAVGGEDVGELHPDRARADDGERPGRPSTPERALDEMTRFSSIFRTGSASAGAGGEDDGLAPERLLAVLTLDLDRVLGRETPPRRCSVILFFRKRKSTPLAIRSATRRERCTAWA